MSAKKATTQKRGPGRPRKNPPAQSKPQPKPAAKKKPEAPAADPRLGDKTPALYAWRKLYAPEENAPLDEKNWEAPAEWKEAVAAAEAEFSK